MIIFKLTGGLGNQMFQYAFIKKISILRDVEVKMDVFWYADAAFGRDEKREYSLRHFNIVENLASREEVKRYSDAISFWHKLVRKIKRDIFHFDDFTFRESEFLIPDNSYVLGYWQSEKYFLDIRDVLLREFTLKDGFSEVAKKIERQQINCNSVSIHIRRGDYVINKKVGNAFGILGLDHYHEAIRLIKEKVSEARFFVYSDDIDWAKENFIGDEFVFVSVPGIRDYEELILMSKCKHNIIANSSFSWWGAWLNVNPDKIVIAPKQWFRTKKINTKDVIPDKWIRI